MVGDRVSSDYIYLRGADALILVGKLNTIAAQYTNDKYVERTRHMGYSDQTEYCESFYECTSDTGYQTDLQLVNVAYGGVADCENNCSSLKVSNHSYYFLASRYIEGYGRYVCHINPDGSLSKAGLDYNGNSNSMQSYIRPIVTLKSSVKITGGDGLSEGTAYTLL